LALIPEIHRQRKTVKPHALEGGRRGPPRPGPRIEQQYPATVEVEPLIGSRLDHPAAGKHEAAFPLPDSVPTLRPVLLAWVGRCFISCNGTSVENNGF